MKRILILLIICLPVLTYAQTALPRGRAQLNMGLSHNVNFYVSGEFAIFNYLTAGFDYSNRKAEATNEWTGETKEFQVHGYTVFANYHFNELIGIDDNWDLYAGANLGLYRAGKNDLGTYSEPNVFGGQLGARWFFIHNLGLNVEGGYYNGTMAKFGLTLRW